MMPNMNKAINHNNSHTEPIKKGISIIHTHKMSIRKLSIKKWSSNGTSVTPNVGKQCPVNFPTDCLSFCLPGQSLLLGK